MSDGGRTHTVIAADFNMEPNRLLDWGGQSRYNLQVVAPGMGEVTCKVSRDARGSLIHYFLVSKGLIECISRVEVVAQVPWHPHMAVKPVLKADAGTIKTQNIIRAGGIEEEALKTIRKNLLGNPMMKDISRGK